MAPAIWRARSPGFCPVQPRPEGWTGKVWAMAQGVEEAGRRHPDAELLLFTDADIAHAPGELRRMVARLIDRSSIWLP